MLPFQSDVDSAQFILCMLLTSLSHKNAERGTHRRSEFTVLNRTSDTIS